VAEPSGVTNTFSYNADRQWFAIPSVAGVAMHLVWDGQAIVATSSNVNALQTIYTQEPATYGGLILQTKTGFGGTTPDYIFDALGWTVGQATSTFGGSLGIVYKAFGEILQNGGTLIGPFLWNGRLGYYYDSALGTYYVRARPFGPTIGRWLSIDPLGLAPDINWYRYVMNNMVDAVDPSGLAIVRVPCKPDDLLVAAAACAPFGGINPAKPTICHKETTDPTNTLITPYCNNTENCNLVQYLRLRANKAAACGLLRSRAAIVCQRCPAGSKAPRPDCNEINRRTANGFRCFRARTAIMDACFNGGDRIHKDERQKVLDVISECNKKRGTCGC
jgi:RHS repeat-associated protein